jgi:hypothetical protein
MDDMNLEKRDLQLGGSFFKRISIPPNVPESLTRWYASREMYIGKNHPQYQWAFSERIIREVRKDFLTLSPLYLLLKGCYEETDHKEV